MILLANWGGAIMGRFVEGADRGQATLLPECLDDWIDEDNPVRAIDAFVHALNLAEMGFTLARPSQGRASRSLSKPRSSGCAAKSKS